MHSATKSKPNSAQCIDVGVSNFGYESLGQSEADSFDAGKERLIGVIQGIKGIGDPEVGRMSAELITGGGIENETG
jgi:hypothetical protein